MKGSSHRYSHKKTGAEQRASVALSALRQHRRKEQTRRSVDPDSIHFSYDGVEEDSSPHGSAPGDTPHQNSIDSFNPAREPRAAADIKPVRRLIQQPAPNRPAGGRNPPVRALLFGVSKMTTTISPPVLSASGLRPPTTKEITARPLGYLELAGKEYPGLWR
jgi:hypothetical protein